MFTKTDSELLKTQNNTRLSKQTTQQSANLTNSDQKLSSFSADLEESNFDLNMGAKDSEKMNSSYVSDFSEGGEIWTKRNKSLAAALVVVLLLIGFSIYHFQGVEDESALENDLVENIEEQPDLASEDQDSEDVSYSDTESEPQVDDFAASDEMTDDIAAEEEPMMEETSESAIAEQAEEEDTQTIVNTEPYTIVKGDWLSKIAKRRLGDAMLWPKVWVLNPQIENPDLIYPGDVITVPKHSRNYADQALY